MNKRAERAQIMLAKRGDDAHFSRRKIADHEVIFVVLADATHVGHPEQGHVNGLRITTCCFGHGPHLPPVAVTLNRNLSETILCWYACTSCRISPNSTPKGLHFRPGTFPRI